MGRDFERGAVGLPHIVFSVATPVMDETRPPRSAAHGRGGIAVRRTLSPPNRGPGSQPDKAVRAIRAREMARAGQQLWSIHVAHEESGGKFDVLAFVAHATD